MNFIYIQGMLQIIVFKITSMHYYQKQMAIFSITYICWRNYFYKIWISEKDIFCLLLKVNPLFLFQSN